MLREYLEGDVRRENRDLRRDLSTLAERVARVEALQQAAIQAAQHADLTDTQRFKLTAAGIQIAPWAGPPSAPPRGRHSAFPRVLVHLLDPKVLIPLSAFIGWLAHHVVK